MEQLTVRYAKREELEQVNRIRRQVNDLHCKGRPDFFKSNAWEDIKDMYEFAATFAPEYDEKKVFEEYMEKRGKEQFGEL